MSPELRTLNERVGAAVGPRNVGQTQATPVDRPECWSTQRIVEHLLLTYRLTAETFAARVAKGTATKATPTLRQRVGQIVLLRVGYFPHGRKAPGRVCPEVDGLARSGAELAGSFEAELERMDGLIDVAEGMFGQGTRAISHQALGPITSQQWREFHLVHGMHHLKQIEAIRREQRVQVG